MCPITPLCLLLSQLSSVATYRITLKGEKPKMDKIRFTLNYGREYILLCSNKFLCRGHWLGREFNNGDLYEFSFIHAAKVCPAFNGHPAQQVFSLLHPSPLLFSSILPSLISSFCLNLRCHSRYNPACGRTQHSRRFPSYSRVTARSSIL